MHLVVVGGGYLGLEVASVARRLGATVTVLEGMPRLLSRVTSPEVSEFFARVHREEGVDIRLNAKIERIQDRDDGRVAVELEGEQPIVANLVLASIGLLPAVELADKAGIEVGNGVTIDEFGRTSAPDVFAVGDCANHPDLENGGRRRLESLPNALETASTVAATIMERSQPYASTPWFWSEQYDTKLQTVGVYRADDEVIVRGNAEAGRSVSVFYLRGGKVRAADIIANPRDFAVAKNLVRMRARVDAATLADLNVSLKEIASRAMSHGSDLVSPSASI